MQTHQSNVAVEKAIKKVAMYVRKSRGDADEDLKNHTMVMDGICKTNGWEYVEYAEIGSGDSIEDRVKMKELLIDVEDGLYDAVIVFDYDRLGRGSGTDQDTINYTFRDSDTLIVVANPYQVLDPNDERDEETMDFKGFMARREYKTITKRLTSGKKFGLKMGRWSNGAAPYGYIYNRDLKKLTPHEQESVIYKEIMIKNYINGMSTNDIAWNLNKKKIRSPRGGLWSGSTVGNLLKSEVHLGHIVYNKSEGSTSGKSKSKRPFRAKPREEWVTVKNSHQAIKTDEEHLRILKLMKIKTRHGNHSVNVLSGLVKCYKCGDGMNIQKVGEKVNIRNCSNCEDSKGGD